MHLTAQHIIKSNRHLQELHTIHYVVNLMIVGIKFNCINASEPIYNTLGYSTLINWAITRHSNLM